MTIFVEKRKRICRKKKIDEKKKIELEPTVKWEYYDKLTVCRDERLSCLQHDICNIMKDKC